LSNILVLHFLRVYWFFKEVSSGISHMYISCINQINLLCYLLFIALLPYYSKPLQYLILYYLQFRCIASILFTIILFFFPAFP
jgi:hypothetical protein